MKLFDSIKNVFLWSYERGSWQYDVLCVIILAFIFLTPASLFDSRLSQGGEKVAVDLERTYVQTTELTSARAQAQLQDLLADVLSQRYQRKVSVQRFEVDSTSDGQILGYRVWFDRNQ